VKAEGAGGYQENLLIGGLDGEQEFCYAMERKFYDKQVAHERCMSKKSQITREQDQETKKRTPTFLLELPLQVNESQAARLRAHLEAGRQFYNAVLSQGQKRLRQMRADPAWQQARAIPRAQKQERARAFSRLREQYGFSEY
jgi:hypothetical protein